MTFKEGFAAFSKAIGMIAPLVLAFVPGGQIPAIAVTAIKLLPALMAKADEVVQGTGMGAIKKDLVMSSAQLAVQAGIELSSGGQKETWEEIAPQVSTIVDVAVAVTKTFAPGTIDEQVNPIFA